MLINATKNNEMNNISYGARLKLWLYKNGFSITFFAKKMGVSRSYLSLVINNKKNPSKRLKCYIQHLTENEVKENF